MDDEQLQQMAYQYVEYFQQAAHEAVRRDHYEHREITNFDEKVAQKMDAMVRYLIDLAGKNA